MAPGDSILAVALGNNIWVLFHHVHVTQPINLLTTKGDLLSFGTNNTRVPVGTSGAVFQANSSVASGNQWKNDYMLPGLYTGTFPASDKTVTAGASFGSPEIINESQVTISQANGLSYTANGTVISSAPIKAYQWALTLPIVSLGAVTGVRLWNNVDQFFPPWFHDTLANAATQTMKQSGGAVMSPGDSRYWGAQVACTGASVKVLANTGRWMIRTFPVNGGV
jgi:hypothetical protein